MDNRGYSLDRCRGVAIFLSSRRFDEAGKGRNIDRYHQKSEHVPGGKQNRLPPATGQNRSNGNIDFPWIQKYQTVDNLASNQILILVSLRHQNITMSTFIFHIDSDSGSFAQTTGNSHVGVSESGMMAQNRTQVENVQPDFTAFRDSVVRPARDTTMNIYTGNPGIYHSPDDTLFYWSREGFTVLFPKEVVTVEPRGPKGFEGKPVAAPKQDWVIGIILLGWILFASLRTGFGKYIGQVFQSIVSLAAASRLYREKGYNNLFGAVRMNAIFWIIMPLALYQVARNNGMSLFGYSEFVLYAMIFIAANGYFSVKQSLYRLTSSIVQIKEEVREMVFNMMLYNSVLGIVLLLVVTVHAIAHEWSGIVQWVGLAIIALFYIFSLIRTIYFSVRKEVSIFYLILYLCTLEILPILLVIKLSAG